MLLAPSVVVHLGPARSGKTEQLVRQYAEALCAQSHQVPGLENLWLAPNVRAAAHVRGKILAHGLRACLHPGVTTFRDLATRILADARLKVRPLRPAAERELVRRVVQRALKNDELRYFADAAGRPAFITLLADHFHELQRGDVSASVYASIRPPQANDDEHRELAHLYSQYDDLLAAHALVNEDRSYLIARDLLAADKTSALRQLNLVVIDGFTDFTRTQHQILRLLADRANQLHISLPSDPPDSQPVPPRADLFAKTSTTLHELQHHHPRLELNHVAPRPLAWPALEHLLTHVFRNPNQLSPPAAEAVDSLHHLKIIAGASVHDEIVQIARSIKQRLITAPARPGDIVVVFRSLADVAPRVREVFDQFGIPYALDARLPIAAAPIVKTLLSILKLDDEDWPFRRVKSVITNNMLTAFDGPARQSAEWLARDLQIAAGRAKLVIRVEQLAAIDTPLTQLGDHMARRVAAAKTALPLLQSLGQTLADLPQEATPCAWHAALGQLAARLGILEANDAAWSAIEIHLASLEHLDGWLNLPVRKLKRREFLHTLIDIAARASLPRGADDVGRVRIVAAPAVRAIRARHLYLAGMSERSFPAAPPAGQLATDEGYRFLARAADRRGQSPFAQSAEQKGTVFLPSAPTRFQEEMLLFYEVLSRAEQSLTVSYPALDDRAQQLPPSPYVLELRRAFGGDQQQKLQPLAPRLSPIPAGAPYSTTDWRIQAVARALEDEPDRRPLAGILSAADRRDRSAPCGLAIDAGLRIVHARAHGETFGPAEGLLIGPAVAARLAARFGASHDWSPSQWESYAACPFKFFLENLLKLAPLNDLVLETDTARRGSRLHGVLAAFHREWPSIRGTTEMSESDERSHFLEHLRRVIEQKTAAGIDGGIDAALLELDRRQIRKWADKHFDHHLKYGGMCTQRGVPMKPTHFEFHFGPPRAGSDESDPNSIDTALLFDIHGEKIRVTGQIDRIDVGVIDGQTVFNVIDYKSGRKFSFSRDHIESGQRLQLPIYVEAAQAMLFDGQGRPLAAGYWWTDGGFDARGVLAVESDDPQRWNNLRGAVAERVGQFVNDIRRGEFPVLSLDEHCTSYCEFNTVCRVAQARSLNKTPTSTTACGLAKSTPSTSNPSDRR